MQTRHFRYCFVKNGKPYSVDSADIKGTEVQIRGPYGNTKVVKTAWIPGFHSRLASAGIEAQP